MPGAANTHPCLTFALEPGTWSGRTRIVLPEDVRSLKVRRGPESASGERNDRSVRDVAGRHQRASLRP